MVFCPDRLLNSSVESPSGWVRDSCPVGFFLVVDCHLPFNDILAILRASISLIPKQSFTKCSTVSISPFFLGIGRSWGFEERPDAGHACN
jgi:hypothetical protein